jgi:YVTN family beta-propeller protein
MNLRISRLLTIVATAGFAALLGIAQTLAQSAYTVGGGDLVAVIDTATNSVSATIAVNNLTADAQVGGLAVSPDGQRVYVPAGVGVAVIDTATNTVSATIPLCGGCVSGGAVAVSPDGSRVYALTAAGTSGVAVIDTATNAVTAIIPLNPFNLGGSGPVVGPDGGKLYVGTYVIDTASETVEAMFPGAGGGMAVTPDGSLIYGTGGNLSEGVEVIDTATNTVIATVYPVRSGLGVAVSPDGSTVYVAEYQSSDVSVIDTTTNTVTATIPLGGFLFPYFFPYGVALTPDGTRVYVTSANGQGMAVIDAASKTVIAAIPGVAGPVAIKPGVGNPGCSTDAFMQNVILTPVGQDMFASFTPPPTVIGGQLVANPSIFQYAAYCGFESFDWRQEWTVLPPVSNLIVLLRQ